MWQVRAVLWLVAFLSEPAIDHPTTPPPLPLLLAVCDRVIHDDTAVIVTSVSQTTDSNSSSAERVLAPS